MQDVFLTNIKQTGAALIEAKYGKVRQCTNDVEIVFPNQDRLHRWARLLRQQTSITVYRLPTEKNKLPFSVSVGSKQTEVFRFRFRLPIAADKRKLTFSITSDFRIYTQNGTSLHMYGKRNYRKTAISVCFLKTVTENFLYIYIYIYIYIYAVVCLQTD
jgi:hypothetical protein